MHVFAVRFRLTPSPYFYEKCKYIFFKVLLAKNDVFKSIIFEETKTTCKNSFLCLLV